MPPVHESRFEVMGCTAHVLLVGGSSVDLASAERRLRELDGRWSRFRPESEVSRLNAAAGHPCVVSGDTALLVERSVTGWAATGGAFDPTVLPALEAAGYDRSFELLGDTAPAGAWQPAGAVPGCGGIGVDARSRLVHLPPGTRVDPGGIGKGLAADLVVDELLASGVAGACVNVGGDLRVAGQAPGADGWVVAVEDPRRPPAELDRIQLAGGALATSSTLVRAWSRWGQAAHHIIDPRTGEPARDGCLAVTVVAGAAWWAEVMAKAALLAGPEAVAVLERSGSTGLAITSQGRVVVAPGYDEFRCLAGAGAP